jgi:hypothetical protein
VAVVNWNGITILPAHRMGWVAGVHLDDCGRDQPGRLRAGSAWMFADVITWMVVSRGRDRVDGLLA